ncbi:MAG: class I SAM-dependent DNA methyltransferase [Saprospiraceae bacterium]|nr:class I SAM-dependent DNA methyltransferase [Saprospiraceae bacterium]
MEFQSALASFLARWSASGAAERANAQSFVTELCTLLGMEPPHPKTPDEPANAYVFEKTIPGSDGSKNFIDCYKRGHFVLESKQGADADIRQAPLSLSGEQQRAQRKTGHGQRGTKAWDTAMEKARAQAEKYARSLPREELADGGRPPFLLVVDVGHSIALYTDWSRAGGHYVPFPDSASYRIALADLQDENIRERLRAVWTDPLSLDPSRRSAKVTRQIADRLARLARSLEGRHDPDVVARFLMRALFTMFAEDVGLLPERGFSKLLEDAQEDPQHFFHAVRSLWETMNSGGYSVLLRAQVPRFNGGLFADATVVELDADQIQLLREASGADWRDVEPAIFGTLLERALDPRERHKLGAHFTPRAYVERLVQPSVIEPLRAEWLSVQAAALQLAQEDKPAKAIAEVEAFLRRLAGLRILDPACGTGNFLYVTLELLKRLEGEVLNTLRELGQGQQSLELAGVMVTPANLLGIELNPRAAAIAELVLWIGFLQWHLRTHGSLQGLSEPIIRDLHNVEHRDAVLRWDERTPLLDAQGQAVTRWDGHSTKAHPVTGEAVPDPDARVQAWKYLNPRPAEWPQADYIVGNPPFIGASRMREALGDGYTEALRKSYPQVPDSVDFVMYWWQKAAEYLRAGQTRRFGFITTNSLRQTFNRRVLQQHLSPADGPPPLSLAFAIPDHPWVDSADGAAVRIAMTVASAEVGEQSGRLLELVSENWVDGEDAAEISLREKIGYILPDLTIGADISGSNTLNSNAGLACKGMMLTGKDFIIDRDKANDLEIDNSTESIIKPFLGGRDIAQIDRKLLVIDAFGMSEAELMQSNPSVYQWLLDRVKPIREQNNRKSYRDFWWLFAEPRGSFRPALKGLERFIVTPRTAKHRYFSFLPKNYIFESEVVAIAFDDSYYLGVLSSRLHVIWALATGAILGPTPRYINSRCFETFPFPTPTDIQKSRIRALGERLDAQRKRQQAQYPELTLTDLYNVLEKERAGEPLTDKERRIHEQGLVGLLRQLHDELDAAVAEAYGWPAGLPEAEILERLVLLNAQRAAEEAAGQVRWLRPEYQAPSAGEAGIQGKLLEDEEQPAAALPAGKRPWPDTLPAQAAALRDLLAATDQPASPEALAAAFEGKASPKRKTEIRRLLDTLAALGQAEAVAGDRWKR